MLPDRNPPPKLAMNELSQVEGFLVDQSLETVEVLTGLETRNHYEIRSSAYDVLYSADEEGGSVVLRALLGRIKPLYQLAVPDIKKSSLNLEKASLNAHQTA